MNTAAETMDGWMDGWSTMEGGVSTLVAHYTVNQWQI